MGDGGYVVVGGVGEWLGVVYTLEWKALTGAGHDRAEALAFAVGLVCGDH